jgi:V/A-type H+-transporting ATPase subunit I
VTLRPQATTWFEVLTPRDHLASALLALSRTKAVELQAHTHFTTQPVTTSMREDLAEYREAQRHYAAYWPPLAHSREGSPRQPAVMLSEALNRLRGWIEDARTIIQRIEQLTEECAALQLLTDLLEQASEQLPPMRALGTAGPLLDARIFVTDTEETPRGVAEGVLIEYITTPQRRYVLAVGPRAAIGEMARLWSADKVRVIRPPPDLPENARAAAALRETIRAHNATIVELRAQLEANGRERGIPEALADLAFLEWFNANVPVLPATENFAWITGWSSDPDCAQLRSALEAGDVPYLLHMPGCPQGLEAPLVLRNPGWARPFEFFARLLGTPGAREADPSMLLAILAPVVFGFMFGDVGHGAVLLIAGLVLRRRYPALSLLIAGGLTSIGFGVLFGTVFAREDVIEPLWLAPLDEPLVLLGASLALGATVVLLGLAIDGMQFTWAGLGVRWLVANAGLVALYTGLLASPFHATALGLVLLGALWFAGGHAYLAKPGTRAAAAGRAVGELAETTLQLIVNTLSFLRVGAFALAHAGLSVAVVGLAEASSGIGTLVVLIIGNLFIIALEALVVGIQTTRLVLFEFFVRFLHGAGRPFRPLPAASSLQHDRKGDRQ